MKRLVMIAVAAVVMLTAFSLSASAFTTSEKVIVANQVIGIARVGAGGYTPDERIDRVNERLAYILGFEPLDPGSIYAVREGASRVIMVGNTQLITITPADAAANHMSVSELTDIWLRNARRALPQARPTPSTPG